MMFWLNPMARGQTMEPRAYSASTVGTAFVGAGVGRSSGSVSFDPTVPITNAHVTLYSPAFGIGQTFGLLGREAMVTATLPYAVGNGSGDVGGGLESIYRSGLADVQVRFSLNLLGVPAMSAREFARRKGNPMIVALSLTTTAPSGQYESSKLINLGTNRWSFKPEAGVSLPVKKVDLDVYGAVQFFTTNGSFYPGGSVRTQDPLASVQAHVSYTVRRRLWVAFDSTWYGGGATHLNGGGPTARLGDSRLGGTLSLPLKKGQSVKVSYSSGVSGRVGADFSTIAVGWQYVWLDRK